MSSKLSSHVTVFGPADRGLHELLVSLGAKVTSIPSHELGSYAAPGMRPDVTILDVRDGQGLPDGVAAFRRRYPDTALVLLSAALDPTLMLEAMRSGITECLTDPVTPEAVLTAIGRVSAQKQADANGDVYAFIGAKGGVGTTTLAVNTATAIARRGEPTLYIDLHAAGGDAAVFLGAEPRFSVSDAFDNIHRLDESLFKTLIVSTKAKVDLLASSSQSLTWTADAKRIQHLLQFAKRHYRFIIVDAARSDATVIDALEPAARIVLVTNQELATLRSGSRMASMLRQRYSSARVVVVANRFDAGADIGQHDIERVLGSSIKHAVPSDYRASIEALTQGTPLILRNHTRMVAPIESLARDLAGLPAASPAPTKGGVGLLGRLTGKR